jgi:hypothetical protein
MYWAQLKTGVTNLTLKFRHVLHMTVNTLDFLNLLCLHQSSSIVFQRQASPFLWVSELIPASATSLHQQQLTSTVPQQSSNSLTYNSISSLTNSYLAL